MRKLVLPLILVTIVSGYFAFSLDGELPNEIIKNSGVVEIVTPAKSENNSQEEKSKSEKIKTKLEVNGKAYEMEITKGSTVYDLMKILSEKTDFTYNGKKYTSIGFFVDEIHGIKNDPETGKFWVYKINNQKAKVGISTYVIQPNDLITWNYENETM